MLSPFDLGAFRLMLSAQLLKQLPPPDASQFGAGVVTYTQTHADTRKRSNAHTPPTHTCSSIQIDSDISVHTHDLSVGKGSWGFAVILTKQVSCCVSGLSIIKVCVYVASLKHHSQQV